MANHWIDFCCLRYYCDVFSLNVFSWINDYPWNQKSNGLADGVSSFIVMYTIWSFLLGYKLVGSHVADFEFYGQGHYSLFLYFSRFYFHCTSNYGNWILRSQTPRVESFQCRRSHFKFLLCQWWHWLCWWQFAVYVGKCVVGLFCQCCSTELFRGYYGHYL